ncbi:hypothetical protein Bp8pC_204 [Bacillus phage Bp8p-C]|uniref:Uncharacterized protein n=2 Tax=Agatevirus Bp8pC TaxID=1910937 RepID=A0A0A0PQV6_9CAUD|nr:hypothetical protein AXJ20_gp144 [Bacillus phage Bp8p-C]YP_009784504.1 hypothetical protein QLX39_gp144 [Bacillus phage Bp8p-T]AHJ87634.1 hypothetical protein Bp8pC_204 [Bacillus phage Bp8p-C]AHJ87845.1 hypothetical protein Bp8pT_204 [Bacillus phage Bp8p-T]
MQTYQDREVKTGAVSKVYFNLHKKVFSVKQNEKVVCHSSIVILSDVTFKVNQKGRDKVLKENRKNVHAYVIGTLTQDVKAHIDETYREATYNPYKFNSFIDKETHQPISTANTVILKDKRIFYK